MPWREDSFQTGIEKYREKLESLPKDPSLINADELALLERKVVQAQRIQEKDEKSENPKLGLSSFTLMEELSSEYNTFKKNIDLQASTSETKEVEPDNKELTDNWDTIRERIEDGIFHIRNKIADGSLRKDEYGVVWDDYKSLAHLFFQNKRIPTELTPNALQIRIYEVDSLRRELSEVRSEIVQAEKTETGSDSKQVTTSEQLTNQSQKKRIEIDQWEEADHPKEAKDLRAEINRLKQRLESNQRITEEELSSFENVVAEFKRDYVQDVVLLAETYENPAQIRKFLEKQYISSSGESDHPNAEDILKQMRAKVSEQKEAEISDREEVRKLNEIISRITSIGFEDKHDPTLGRSLTRKELLSLGYDLNNATQGVRTLLADGDYPGIQRNIKNAQESYEDLIKLKPVATMAFSEIVDEILNTENFDVYDWGKWKNADPSRYKDLFNAYTSLMNAESEAEDSEVRGEENLRRIVLKTKVQLSTLDDKLGHETGKASTDRSKLYEQLSGEARNVVRSELLMSTTEHPRWGRLVKDLIDFIVFTGGRKSNEPEYISELSYEQLASSSGRDNLDKWIKRKAVEYKQRYVDLSDEDISLAVFFATKLFTTFDMLTICLQQRQKQTATRGHNAAIEDIDRVLLQDPIASYVHRAQRYGGNEKDWTGWWLLYLPAIPPDSEKYGAKSKDGRQNKAREIHETQEMIRVHQLVHYDLQGVAGAIDEMGYCESIFPDSRDWTRLHPSEYLRVMDKLLDSAGNVRATFKGNEIYVEGERIATFDERNVYKDAQSNLLRGDRPKYLVNETTLKEATLQVCEYQDDGSGRIRRKIVETIPIFGNTTDIEMYKIAEQGWYKILEMCFQDIPENLTKEQIMSEVKEGGKGGLLNAWLSEAGKAKMMPGQHLERTLAPLLTHFLLRLFAHFVGTTNESRTRLFAEVLVALNGTKESGGLASGALKSQMDKVIKNLGGLDWFDSDGELKQPEKWPRLIDSLRPSENYRGGQLKEYINLWWKKDKKRDVPGSRSRLIPNTLKTTSDIEYFDYLDRRKPAPQPINRSGSMLQVKEAGK